MVIDFGRAKQRVQPTSEQPVPLRWRDPPPRPLRGLGQPDGGERPDLVTQLQRARVALRGQVDQLQRMVRELQAALAAEKARGDALAAQLDAARSASQAPASAQVVEVMAAPVAEPSTPPATPARGTDDLFYTTPEAAEAAFRSGEEGDLEADLGLSD
jgi:Tfp pilus assembly protein FimV